MRFYFKEIIVKYVMAIFVSMMLAFSMPALADCGGGNGAEDPPAQGCHPGDDDNGGGGDSTGGSYTNTNNNSNTNTNQQGQEQGQAQGQLQGQIQGQVATGGDATSVSGAGVFGSGNSDNTNTATGGSVGDVNVSVGGINTSGYGEGESAPGGDINSFSPTATVGDTSNTNTSSSFSEGGAGGNASINIGTGYSEGQGSEGGSGILSSNVGDVTATNGDQTTTVDNTDNSYNAGNTLVIGGGYQGECSEGGCEGGSGTLNSNADATATSGDSSANNELNNSVVVNNNFPEGTTGGTSQVVEGSSQVVEGDTTDINVDARTINEATEMPVNGVAPSFSGLCNSGAAGQGRDFGLSVSVTNDVCQALMMADAYMAMGKMEEAEKWVEAAARHAKWKGGMGYVRHIITLGAL